MFALVHLCDRDKVEEVGLGSGAETSLRAGLCSGILLHGVYCRLVFKFTVVLTHHCVFNGNFLFKTS